MLYVTLSRLRADLESLGLCPGQTVMLHASVRAIGWVVGGPDVVLQALLDTLGPEGTVMMYVGWEDAPYHLKRWPRAKQEAYLAECPPYDPARSRAYRKWSILTEYLRTWPGACRSGHPDGSFAAVGARAAWLTADHPLQYGYGPGSPLDKLCQASGQVLLLGSPLDSITLLHHSEHLAQVANKRIARYSMPMAQGWVDIEEFDTSAGIVDSDVEYFELIAQDFLTGAQEARQGLVGAAQAYLLGASALRDFGLSWIERRFG